MLPLLRSRPSRLIVALLCAFILSRLPAQTRAGDVVSSVMNIEMEVALPAVAVDVAAVSIGEVVVTVATTICERTFAPDEPYIQQSVLRI
jgi:hypothetical protein